MTNCHSSLAQLLQSTIEENSESTSLFDLINAHKSFEKEKVDQEINSLSDLTSKHLNFEDQEQNTSNNIISQPNSFSVSFTDDNINNRNMKSDQFNTLEEYTRSFLSSNINSTFLSQKPSFFLSKSPVINETEGETTVVIDKLSNVKICHSNQQEMSRKIDLTAALLSTVQNTSTPSPMEYNPELNGPFFYPIRECIIDISSLANEDILCSNNKLSYFGYVISKKWNHVPMPKKYRKISRIKPYNITKSFKFDTPSPDDIALKARNRTMSGSNKD